MSFSLRPQGVSVGYEVKAAKKKVLAVSTVA